MLGPLTSLPPDIALSIYHKLGILGKLGLPGVLGEALLGKTIANKGVNLLQSIGIGQ